MFRCEHLLVVFAPARGTAGPEIVSIVNFNEFNKMSAASQEKPQNYGEVHFYTSLWISVHV